MRNHRPLAVLTAAGLATSLLLSGCAGGAEPQPGSSESAAPGEQKVSIGVVFQSNVQPRWRFDAAEMEDEAKKQGYDIVVKYADGTAEKQADQIEQMVAGGINALIVNSADAEAIGALARKLREEGIKVISYDQAIKSDVDLNTSRSLIEAGQAQAQAAVEAVPSGEFGLIRGDNSRGPNAAIFDEQYQAVLAEHPDINVVYSSWTAKWDATKAQKEAEAALLKNPDIAAFIVSNDGMAAGVVQALRGANRAGEVFVTGLDAYEENLHLIYEGLQGMTIFTDVVAQSRHAVNAAAALVRGEKVEGVDETAMNGEFKAPYLNAPIIVVTKDTLCDFFEVAPQGWADPKVVFGGESPCK